MKIERQHAKMVLDKFLYGDNPDNGDTYDLDITRMYVALQKVFGAIDIDHGFKLKNVRSGMFVVKGIKDTKGKGKVWATEGQLKAALTYQFGRPDEKQRSYRNRDELDDYVVCLPDGTFVCTARVLWMRPSKK